MNASHHAFVWRFDGTPVHAVIELPITPALVEEMREVFRDRLTTATRTRCTLPLTPSQSDVEQILTRHAAAFHAAYMAPCGWTCASRFVLRHGVVMRLCWPWDMARVDITAAPMSHHVLCHRAHAPHKVLVVRMQQRWVDAHVRDYVQRTDAGVSASAECVLVDMVSRLTDAEAHQRFAPIIRFGVKLVSGGLDDNDSDTTLRERGTQYCCNATLAATIHGGVYRFFAPHPRPVGDLTHLRGFVSDAPSILYAALTCEAAREGGLVFHEPLIVDLDDTTCMTGGEAFLRHLADDDVVRESDMSKAARESVLSRMSDATFLREHGLSPDATRSVWPYRIAFCRAIASAMGHDVQYAEMRDIDGGRTACVSARSVVFGAGSGMRTVATSTNMVCLLYDGARWALRPAS